MQVLHGAKTCLVFYWTVQVMSEAYTQLRLTQLNVDIIFYFSVSSVALCLIKYLNGLEISY